MRTIWFVIYNTIGILFLWIFFRVYSLFNIKVREGLRNRRDLFGLLDKSLSSFKNKKTVLIHSSSLGEYQQALPLVDEFLKNDLNVVLSFFSPSGYNNSKNLKPGVIKTYLPFDSVFSERKFLDKINPSVIVFMRYDLWYNILHEAKKRSIKTILANARYDEKDMTWKIPVINSFKKTLYGMIDTAFVIDKYDESNYKERLKKENVNIVRTGDSKFERVFQTARSYNNEVILPENIIKDKKIIVIGSSWKEDEDVILPAINKAVEYYENILTILVPHEPKETKISAIENIIESRYNNLSTIRYSELSKYGNENFIIVDKIGLLSKLYSIAYLSYVGGGFKTGLHNILEPAIFNMPILFSNKVKNSDEDEILLKYGCGMLIEDTRQFYRLTGKFLKDKKFRDETGVKCKFVFKDSAGIAEKIVNHIVKEN